MCQSTKTVHKQRHKRAGSYTLYFQVPVLLYPTTEMTFRRSSENIHPQGWFWLRYSLWSTFHWELDPPITCRPVTQTGRLERLRCPWWKEPEAAAFNKTSPTISSTKSQTRWWRFMAANIPVTSHINAESAAQSLADTPHAQRLDFAAVFGVKV